MIYYDNAFNEFMVSIYSTKFFCVFLETRTCKRLKKNKTGKAGEFCHKA